MSFFSYILDLIFPSVCYCCRYDIEPLRKHPLCSNCEKKLRFIETPYCSKCGIYLRSDTGICHFCKTKNFIFDFSRSVFMYEEAISSVIKAYKYRGKDYLYKWFGYIMLDRFNYYQEFNCFDSITYVPVSNNKMKERGFDQSQLIAMFLSKHRNLNFIENAIENKKNVSQVDLSSDMRSKNVIDNFIVKNSQVFYKKRVIIIDDVATTMSTLNEVSKVIKKSGASSVSCFTIARQQI